MILLLDLGVILILALSAWRGWVKGFVLTLCGLLAVVLAFFGANYASAHFSEPVADFIRPYVSDHLEKALDTLPIKGKGPGAAPSPTFSLPMLEDTEIIPEELEATLSELLNVVRQSEVFSRLADPIETAIKDGSLSIDTTALSAVAAFISLQITRVVLFFLTFVLILIVWWLFSHAADLAFHLPVLRTLNEAGGLVLGVVKALLILVVLCSGLTAFDVVSPDIAAQTKLFSLFLRFHII